MSSSRCNHCSHYCSHAAADEQHRRRPPSGDGERCARCQPSCHHQPCCSTHHHHHYHLPPHSGSRDPWLSYRAPSPQRCISPPTRRRRLSPWVSPPRERESRYEAFFQPRQRDPWDVEPYIFAPPFSSPTLAPPLQSSSTLGTSTSFQPHPLYPHRTGPPLYFGPPRTFPKRPSHFSPRRSSHSSRRPAPLTYSPPLSPPPLVDTPTHTPSHSPPPTPHPSSSHSSVFAYRPSTRTSTHAHRRRLRATRRLNATTTTSTFSARSHAHISQPAQQPPSTPTQQQRPVQPVTPDMFRPQGRPSSLFRRPQPMRAQTPPLQPEPESPFWPLEGLSLAQQLEALNVRLNRFQPGLSQYVLPVYSDYLSQRPRCFGWTPPPAQQASTQTTPPQSAQRREPYDPNIRMCPPSLPSTPLKQPSSSDNSANKEGFWWNPTSRRETRPQAAPSAPAPARQAPLEPARQQPHRLQVPQLFARPAQRAQHPQPAPSPSPPRPATPPRRARARSPAAPPPPVRRSMYDPTPLVQSTPPPGLGCWFCRENHFSSSCQNVPRISDRIYIHMRNARCFRCGGQHLDYECEEPYRACPGCGLDDHHIAFCAHNRQAVRDLSNERWLRHMRRARSKAFIARRLKEEDDAWLRNHLYKLELEENEQEY